MFKNSFDFVFLICFLNCCNGQIFLIPNNHFSDLKEVFSWKQIRYDFNGVKYTKDAAHERIPGAVLFKEEVNDNEMFFIQYNNVPIGLEVYQDRVFITVPRRRYGIPSTLNYVDVKESSPLLKPYPDVDSVKTLVSVYRPRVDVCGRLWVIDTGNLEVPNARVQKKSPQIVIFDLKTNKEVLRYDLPSDVIADGGKSTYGLTSITVDVTASTCDDAYAYITDLLGNGLIVFSLKQLSSWRFNDQSFNYDVGATDFRSAHQTLNWTDGLFSIALSDPDGTGRRTAYYHPLVSTLEFSVDTNTLKNRGADFKNSYKLEGVRGVWSQSGSHAFHSGTKTLLYANVAQDAIMCWNTQIPLTSKTTAPIVMDHSKLVYISDLKIVGDDVWVLVNQIPKFIYDVLDTSVPNFYVFRGKVQDMIKGTVCDKKI